MRPDGSFWPSPIRRMAVVTLAPPSITSPASCGQLLRVSPTSTMLAAIREDSSVGPISATT